jgi:phosphodiesterase/alkaline phosphatase D-like protein/uncharacterized protein YjiK/2',3'-cyclic-nucleotide 2'-phosphodiesterase (5'-nucleotidase family)
LTDTAGHNSTISITTSNNVTLYTAASGTVLKGVAFAPVSVTTPTLTGAATATSFTTTYGTPSATQTFSVSGSNLTTDVTATAPTGFEVSSDGTTFGSTATFTQSGGTASGTLRVRLAANAAVTGTSYNSQNIALTSTGASTVNVTTAATGNTVSAKALTIAGLTANNKTYDGTTVATVAGTAAYSGLVNDESFSVSGTPSFAFSSAAVGDAKTVAVTGYTAPSSNYSLTQPSLVAEITPAALTITANQAVKPFGSALSTVTGSTAFSSSGLVNGETVGSVTLNYGTGAAAGDAPDTYLGSVVPSDATGGTFTASNYTITYVAGNLVVSGSPVINVAGALSAFENTYGTASAPGSFNVSGGNLTGNLTVSAPAGFEISSAAGSGFGATVTLSPTSGWVALTPIYVRLAATTAAGSHVGNVSVSGGGATAQSVAIPSSTVNPKALTLTGLTAQDKVYDRTTTATVSGTATLEGVVAGDEVMVAGSGSFNFADVLVSSAKPVTATGFSLAGSAAGNYSLTQPTGLSAAITAKALTLAGAAVLAKPYDGTTSATITGALDGVVSPDEVTFTGAGTFASAEIGTGIGVTANLTLGGANAANYTVTQPTGLSGDILKANQTITFTAPGTKNLGDPNFDLVATASSGLPVSFISSNPAVATISGTTVTIVGLGTTDITASQGGNATYNAAPDVVRTLTVSKPPTTLGAGDIAIIGYNTSGTPDNFTILVLKELNPGTVFYVNDNEVASDGGTSFTDLGEGEASFTVKAGQTIPAGTVINLPWGGAAVSATTYDYSSTSGFGLGNNNEELYLYTATGITATTPTAFIFFAKIGTSTSARPAGLTAGTTFISPSGTASRYKTSGAVYSGSVSALLTAIGNTASNWETVAPGANTDWAFTLNSTVSLANASVSEGNSGTTTLDLVVTRSDTTTAFTVDFAVTGGDATSGTDFVALSSGTLTFAAGGSSSQTIQITVNGDTAFESNETIEVTLSNVVNTTGTTVISTATGIGTITNDDVVIPSFTTQPANTSIASGASATLSVAVGGFPVPTLQWYAGISGDTSSPVSGATSASFITPALTATTSYWVRATNSVGSTDSGTATVAVSAAVTSVNLANYVRVGRYNLPEPTRTALPSGTPTHNYLCQEASAVTYNWDTDTLFITGDGGRAITQVSKTGELIDTMTLALGSSPQGTDFYDPEGLTYIGSGQFVLSEERDRQLVLFTYAAGTTLSRSGAKTVKLGTFVDNIGIEGLSWDPQTSGYVCVKEASPIGIFQTSVDFDGGTASNGSASTVNSTNLFDPALLGMTDVADVFALSNLPGTNGQAQGGNLLVLSQEDGKIVNIDRSGNIASTLVISSDVGNPLNVSGQQHEGLTMDRSGFLYVVNENGGGSIDYPQLWVYAPSTAANAAPTQLAVNGAITSLPENTSTVSRVALGDIVTVDDGLGTNTLAVTGTDAALFEIIGSTLFLKAGTPLDFETKTSYSITLTADDTTVGSTPDVTTAFTLAISDIVAESAPAPAIIISEFAPWSSSNSPVIGADWFEVTNTTTSAIDITGWKVDDNSNSFASSVALTGITSIAPGESVIFLESSTANPASTVVANFKSVWFGANVPAGLQVGTYQGSGIGLSSSGDALNLYNASGVLQANVTFGASPSAAPYATFDNTAGVNSAAVTQLSVAGARGAFFATNGSEIGSPGYAQPALLVVSEIAPWSSGNSAVLADWFEVTNIGGRVISIEGWKVDDSSESPAAAVSLTGINSIAPGESVIFLESATPSTTIATFRSTWGVPTSLQIGSYSGSGIGLSTGSDAVNLYDTTNTRRANIAFGASPTTSPFATFENATALTLGTVSRLSVSGVNGAYTTTGGSEIGSPGTINKDPFVAQTILAQAATAGGAFSFTLPANAFSDPESGALTFSATLIDGSSLPAWLTFNAATGTLSGTPSAVDLGRVVVRITATDNGTPGRTAALDVTVNVAPAAGSAFFPQSVASGDPRDTSVVLWTRLMDGDTASNRSVSLHLSTTGPLAEVGTTGALGGTNLWTGGTLTAQSAHDGVVKVKVTGLTADTAYYYQFTYNGQRSPIGRTRTAPAAGSTRSVKYAAINCNDFVGRYFNVLKHLADQEADNIDFVLNLGDYIYETTGDASFQTTSPGRAMVLSKPSEAIDLGGGNYAAQSIGNYRDIYKTIRQDRQLQRVHELFPMISIWDDHEFSDDNWKDNATFFDGKVNEQQTARKRNGEQAWMEFLPTERGLAGSGNGLEVDASDLYPNTVIYDSFNFGGNLDLVTTDIRTERADHLIPEEAFPASVPMDESAVIATLAAAYGMDVATFTAAAWPGIKSNFAPYVNIDDSAYAAVKAGLQAIVSAGVSVELAALPTGQTAVTTGSAYAAANVAGNLDASFVNSSFAAAGLAQPFDAAALNAMPRGLSFFLLGKTGFFSDFGSRYQLVNQTFQLYAGYTYQAFLASGGTLGRNQAFFGSTQQTFLGTALATSAAAGRTWRVVASSTPYTPIKLELGDLPTGVSLPTQGTISGVTIPASIPSQFLVEFLLNADEPAGFPQYRQGIIDLLAQHDAIIVSGDIHAQLIGNNSAANGQKVVDFTVPSAASSQFRRAVNGAFASVEALMTPSVRAATGLTGNFAFDTAQKNAVINATDAIIKKNTPEMFDADTATHGYTVFTAAPAAFTANFRKIDVNYIDDNLYGETSTALDALFQRQEFTVTKTGTGAASDLILGVPTTVTTTVAGSTGGSVSGGGTLVTGTSATFTATPDAGFTFRGWKVNGSAAGSTNPLTTTVTAGMTVEASFSFSLQLLHLADGEAGLLAPDTAPYLAALVDQFDGTYANTLILAGGDNFIPSPFLNGGTDLSVRSALNAASGSTISTSASTNHPIAAVDIAIHNILGVEASAIGNHEFDLGSKVFRDAFTPGSVSGWVGATFPHISANLDFSADSDMNGRFTNVTLDGTATSVPQASAGNGRVVPMAVITKGGQKIGLLGATTQLLRGISSPTGTIVKGYPLGTTGVNDMDQLAGVLQPYINELLAEGVNKIVLMAHLQQIANEQLLATKLSGVDVILAAGSNTRLGDADDVAATFPGHAADFANTYPISTTGTDGKPVLILNTDNEYTYLGRLVVDFDANGEVITSDLTTRVAINGAYAATASRVASVWGVSESDLASTAFAAGTKGAKVKALTDAVLSVVNAKDGAIRGYTDVYLEGERAIIRNQETNLGNLTADANAAALLAIAPTGAPVVSFKNGGGIRAQIGAVEVGSGNKIPPVANPGASKPAGAVSVLDIENSLRFNNRLMVFDTTPAGLKAILEHGVASLGNQGRFPQIGGVRFSYNPTGTAGSRVLSIALVNGSTITPVYGSGAFLAGAPTNIRLVTLNFLASNATSANGLGTGGDGYPMRANGTNFRFILDNGTLSAAVSPTLNFTDAAVVPANALGEQTALGNYLSANHATPATAFSQADTPEASDLRIQNTSVRTDTVITPAYSFAAAAVETNQSATSVTLTVNRSYGANAGSVTIRTNDGTASTVPPFSAAVATTDYVDADGTVVSFAAGETSKTVNITLVPKTAVTTPNRRFVAELLSSTDGIIGTPATTQVQILATDAILPTLSITTPLASAAVSDLSPYTVRGTAGDARGIERVTVALNGATALEASLGTATVPTSVPWSVPIAPVVGVNTIVVTASDFSGNTTTLTRTFTFTQRFVLSLSRTAPSGVALDTAGTVALVATPATNATALLPSTANADPRLANIVPGTTVTLTATAKTGYAFTSWSGLPSGATALGNVATFTMPSGSVSASAAFQASTVFAGATGTDDSFFGLILPGTGTATSNSSVAFLSGDLNAGTGTFTGRLLFNGLSYSFTARVFGDGSVVFGSGATSSSTLTVGIRTLALSYDVSGKNTITGTLTGSGATSTGTARRAIYSATNLVPSALLNSAVPATGAINRGTFTVAFPAKTQTPALDAATYPQGEGYATLTLTNAGVVTGTGVLADNTAFTVSSALVNGNQCPIFAQLTTPGQAATARGGSFLGTLVFDTTQADTDVAATDLTWIRPDVTSLTPGTTAAAIAAADLYTAGWPNGITIDAIGALYDKTKTVQAGIDLDGVSTDINGNTLSYEDGKLVLSGGKLASTVTKQNFIVSGNTVTKLPSTDLSFTLALTASSGSFTGTFLPNWTPLARTNPGFKGILLQKGAHKGGHGFFISNASADSDPEAGNVNLTLEPFTGAPSPVVSTTPSIVSAASYTLNGTAGNARGVDRVEVFLNGSTTPLIATLGTPSATRSVTYSVALGDAVLGSNTAVITVVDLRGNRTSTTFNFTFNQRFPLVISRTVPSGISVDTAGTIAMTAVPATKATSLLPTTANANPRSSTVEYGTAVTVTATPKTGYAFVRWTGLPTGSTVTGNIVSFPMPTAAVNLTAEFATASSLFAGATGTGTGFYGLIRPESGTATSNATVGFLSGTLSSSTGVFTGTILVDGVSQAVNATFYGNGTSTFPAGTAKQNSLTFGGRTLSLSLNTDEDKDEISVTLTSAGNTSSGVTKRAIFSATNTAPAALLNATTSGFATLVFPSTTQSSGISTSAYPQGDGFGQIALTSAGLLTIVGTLADNTSFTASTALVEGGEAPFMAQILTPGSTTARGGSFGGTLKFDTTLADSDVTGLNMLWIRPSVTEVSGTTAAALATQLYTAGWPSGIQVDALGALYNKALTVQVGLGLGVTNPTAGNAKLTFSDGKLTSGIVKTNFNVNGSVVAKIPTTDTSFTLTTTASTGSFTGSIAPNWTPTATALPTFKGIILQKGANQGGFGFFLSNQPSDTDPESGGVSLTKP